MSKNPKTIFPKEVIGFSVEALLNKHSAKSSIIYQIILVVIIISIIMLPFIKVDVTLNGTGVVQSKRLQSTIVAGPSAKIIEKYISLNQHVTIGDTLFILDNTFISSQINDLRIRISIKEEEIDDLNKLLTNSSSKSFLNSRKYRQSADYLNKTTQDLDIQINIKESAWRREKLLFDSNASYKAKLEEAKVARDVLKNQKILTIEKFKAQWNSELQMAILDLSESNNRLNQLTTELNQYYIIAPKSGYITDLQGGEVNSYVYPNQKLCVISPNEELLLDCYIKPSDIGLIETNQKVNIRIDAFNYQQWGMLKAEVVEIFNDVTLLNNQHPVFTVRCKPNQDFLELENGYKGELRKGMSFQANFMVAERSLFDLLFDKVDDWLVPNANKKQY